MLINGDYDNFTFNEDWCERLKTCILNDTLLSKIGGEILGSSYFLAKWMPKWLNDWLADLRK